MIRFSVITLCLVMIIGCQSSRPLVNKTAKELPYGGRSQPLVPQSEFKIPSGTNDAAGKMIDLKIVPITLSGENTEPNFSKDGVKLLFVSRERAEHSHAQVYELTLNPLRERRVTYHDGDDSSPVYHPDGVRLLYASTTDSLKNDPVFIDNLKKLYSPQTASVEPTSPLTSRFDIFLSRLDGRDISHVLPPPVRSNTNEAELTIGPKGRIIAYVSESNDRSDVYVLPLSGGSPKRVTSDRELDFSPKLSSDGSKLVWVKNVPKGSQLMMSSVPFAKAEVLSRKIVRNQHPSWHPNGEHIIFSSDRSGDGNFDLYIYSLKSKCLTRASQTPDDENSPAFSPDGSRFVYSSNIGGRDQLYLAEMKGELVSGQFCLQDTL